MAATMIRLYEATDALQIIFDWIYEHDEEIRAMEGALPAELADLLAKAEGDFKAKAERVALFIRELLANAEAVKLEEQRLVARRKHYEKAADGLKRYLLSQMTAADIPKIEGKLVTVRTQKSPPSLVAPAFTQETLKLIRDEFVTVVPETRSLNGRAIIEHWKQTGESPVEGVEVTQGLHVRIV